ncbi:MAG TPA: hypothetical protein VFV93_08665 [Thermomicrobiales bacterium]|nr:hypothetical protein [Thermomicrobiales bacterium]
MTSQTIEIRAIWKERPSWFASGMMQWVAETVGQDGSQQVATSPAFPLDSKLVVATEASDKSPYIVPDLGQMDDKKRRVVEEMLADFVRSLERQGWVQTGQGSDWFSYQFQRGVSQ